MFKVYRRVATRAAQLHVSSQSASACSSAYMMAAFNPSRKFTLYSITTQCSLCTIPYNMTGDDGMPPEYNAECNNARTHVANPDTTPLVLRALFCTNINHDRRGKCDTVLCGVLVFRTQFSVQELKSKPNFQARFVCIWFHPQPCLCTRLRRAWSWWARLLGT